MTKKLLGLLAVILLCACTQKQDAKQHLLLQELLAASPVNDARQAIASGDLRFVAVHNHHLIMPANVKPCLVERHDYFVLSNQALDYGSFDYQKYGAVAQIYANWYNNEIMLHLIDSQQDHCKE